LSLNELILKVPFYTTLVGIFNKASLTSYPDVVGILYADKPPESTINPSDFKYSS
jgi:hypothetical protein